VDPTTTSMSIGAPAPPDSAALLVGSRAASQVR
jgi:hypothetical protein